MHGQLYGEVPLRQATSPPDRRTLRRWLLVLALLCAVGFVMARYAPHAFQKARAVAAPKPAINLSDADTEDLLQHIDDAIAAQATAAAALRQSCGWMDRAVPLVEAGSLAARRLDLARSASRAAEERISRTRDELQITRNVLIERSTHREQ